MWLIWPREQKSSDTMTYQMAIDLLDAPSQPSDARLSALAQTTERIREGISRLQSIRDDTQSPDVVRQAASYELTLLRDVVATPELPRPLPVDDTLAEQVSTALDHDVPISTRISAITQIAFQTRSGLTAVIRASGLLDSAEFARKRAMSQAQELLSR